MIASTFRHFGSAFVLACLLSLTSCSSISGEKAVTQYSPQLHVASQAQWPSVHWSLAIAKPVTSEALDSARIAVRRQPNTLQVYQGAVWSDTAPDLLQSALMQAFEDSGKLVSVSRQSSGITSNCALLIDLRRFEAAYDDSGVAPQAVIELRATLVSSPGNAVLATRTFRTAVRANNAQIPAVIAAFEAALSQSLGDVVGWTLASGPAPAK